MISEIQQIEIINPSGVILKSKSKNIVMRNRQLSMRRYFLQKKSTKNAHWEKSCSVLEKKRFFFPKSDNSRRTSFNDEISEFFSRGFNIFQISQNVRLGVLIFSMLWPFLDHFALKNSLKKTQNFSRASRANFFSGVLIFSKIQDFFRGGFCRGGVLILSAR